MFNILFPPEDKLYFPSSFSFFFPNATLFHFFFQFPCCFFPSSSQPFPLPLGAYPLLCPDASLFPRGAVSHSSAGGSHGPSQVHCAEHALLCPCCPSLPAPVGLAGAGSLPLLCRGQVAPTAFCPAV